MNERFDMAEDARAELHALAQRLEHMEFEERAPPGGDDLSPPREAKVRRSFTSRIGDFFFSLSRLPQTRRRLLQLEDRVLALNGQVSAVARGLRALAEHAALKSQVDEISRFASREQAALKTQVDEGARLAFRERVAVDVQIDEVASRVDELKRVLQTERATRQRAFTDFERRLTLRGLKSATAESETESGDVAAAPTSVWSLLETFYFLLEDRYRGSREEIKQRLLVYRNDLRAARDRTGITWPVIDIGCGRGELLEVLAEEGFRCIGVDSNDTQLETARKHGGAVVHGDALEYLRSLEAASVLAVTGIHIVEHIPFRDLVRLMQEVVRVLRKGGVAIFETPNPRNLIVGATTFHLDPTHIKPLPAEVMQILLETVGFDRIETRPLHPSDTLETMVKQHNLDRDLANLLFGPQDYAVIGLIE